MKTKLLFNNSDTMLFLFLIFFLPTITNGQNFNYSYNVELLEVSFSGNDFYEISKDNGSGLYNAPHWTPNDKKPIVYVSGSKPKVSAKFHLNCQNPVKVLLIKGIGNGFEFPEQMANNNNNLGDFYYPMSEALNSFSPDKVDFFEPFVINWLISKDNGENWIDAGTSNNPLYVTLKTPAVSSIYHTVIHVSCKNSIGLTNEGEIVKSIYSDFENRDVRRVSDNYHLSYWDLQISNNLECFSFEQLLKYGDGRCGAWADFFDETVKVQGISGSTKVGISHGTPEPSQLTINYLENKIQNHPPFSGLQYSTVPQYLFMVKNWFNIQNDDFINLNAVNIDQAQSSPGDFGIKGQKVDDPMSIFPDHAITKFVNGGNTILYDPSYGTFVQSGSAAEWEDQGLHVTKMILFWVGSSSDMKWYAWIESKNVSNLQELSFQ